jgi:hypothetical protein
VPLYQIYAVEADGKIATSAYHVDCKDDQLALNRALEYYDGDKDIEIKQGPRLVAVLPRIQKSKA